MKPLQVTISVLALLLFTGFPATMTAPLFAEDWTQYKFDSEHSGDAPNRALSLPLSLVGAAPLTDAIFTAPVVADGRVYVVDGSGVAFCFDAATLRVVWKFASRGGRANCNNVSSPALAGRYLHFGTMAGVYYVLDAAKGALVREIVCGEPIFSAPVVGPKGVYFATLGSRIYALEPDGSIRWTWDFVREKLGFEGDRWNGADWVAAKGKATWREQFCCSRNLAVHGNRLFVPAGGTALWLEDAGETARVLAEYYPSREAPATLSVSLDAQGTVYRQWTRRDNGGRVEILRLADGKVSNDWVRGTDTSYKGAGLLSYSSVSVRSRDVYRTRPQEGFGLCRHSLNDGKTQTLGGGESIAPPILLRERAVYGGLDGRLYIVPLSGQGEPWSFTTAFGKAISAPVAIADGRVYFSCEDGYLYVLGPDGKAPLPTRELQLYAIRSPLTGKKPGAEHDRNSNFANFANTNANGQGLAPPFKLKWIRRYEGTVKHFSVCGGGRMYTHTAEGQIFAVEQETGRQLWRRFFPGVHVSFTAPLYYRGRLLVPQAGLKRSRLRCLDAADGRLLWEAPFSGSPSWNRQLSPIVHEGLVFYPFSTGRYTPATWLFEHQSTKGFPADQRPLVRAWELETGKEVWTRDFSEYGAGGDDAGLCLLDGALYYSSYFGDSARRDPEGAKSGVTVALEPATGRVRWATTKHAVHSGCTISAEDGRLYLGGYNPVEGKTNRIWCLDARDGSLIWKSDPVHWAIHVVTIGREFLFTHSQYGNGCLIDKRTGKIARRLTEGYRCTRFTLSEPYLLGPNLEVFDLSDGGAKLVSSGPAVDVLICVGSFVSNGRIFYTANGGGLQASQAYGAEAASFTAPWMTPKQ